MGRSQYSIMTGYAYMSGVKITVQQRVFYKSLLLIYQYRHSHQSLQFVE